MDSPKQPYTLNTLTTDPQPENEQTVPAQTENSPEKPAPIDPEEISNAYDPYFGPIKLPGKLGKYAKTLREIFRFCITGVLNTAVYYVFYRLFLLLLPYLVSHVLGWFVATLFSYVMNCIFVFKVRPTWKRFIRFPAAPIANLIISTLLSALFVSYIGMSQNYGTVLAGIIAIPITFTIARTALVKIEDPKRED